MPTEVASYDPIEIVAFGCEPKAIPVTIKEGEDLPKGAALGRITASGLYVGYDDDGTDDGRRTAQGLLTEAVDASDGDVVSSMYIEGEFMVAALPGSSDAGYLDANGLADLNGRVIERGSEDILVF